MRRIFFKSTTIIIILAALGLTACSVPRLPRVPLPKSLPALPKVPLGAATRTLSQATDKLVQQQPQHAFFGLPPGFEASEILGLDVSPASATMLRALGFKVLKKQYYPALDLHIWRIQAPAGSLIGNAISLLQSKDRQGQYKRNSLYRLNAGSQPCIGSRCYGQELIGLQQSSCTQNLSLGLIDSGVELLHIALMGQKISARRHDPAGRASPQLDHGTALAALLVGAQDSDFPGMLPQSRLYAADIFSLDENAQAYTDVTAIIDALDWMATQGVHIINMSFAGPANELLEEAIKRTAAKNILMVAAAGNSGPNSPPQYPAAYPEVIAVTAVDRHLRRYDHAVIGDQIELSAPGVGIWSTGRDGSGQFRQGTSFAAPFVTAAAAAYWNQHPQLSARRVKLDLIQQVEDLGQAGWDRDFGWGLVKAQLCE